MAGGPERQETAVIAGVTRARCLTPWWRGACCSHGRGSASLESGQVDRLLLRSRDSRERSLRRVHRLHLAPLPRRLRHGRLEFLPPLLGHSGRKLRLALARPTQRRHGIATRHRVNERLQRFPYSGLRHLNARTSSAGAANSSRRLNTLCQFTTTVADRLARQTCSCRDERITAIANSARFRRRPQSPGALVEDDCNVRVLGDDLGFQFYVTPHSKWLISSRSRWQTNSRQPPKRPNHFAQRPSDPMMGRNRTKKEKGRSLGSPPSTWSGGLPQIAKQPL